MIKKLLLTAFLGLCSLAASAQMQEFEFTYASTDSIGARGVSQADHYDVANIIVNYTLGGGKITGITAYMNLNDEAAGYIVNPKVWLSKDLSTNGVPDIVSVEATLEPAMYGVEPVYSISATLPEPYILDSDPIVVGYSFDIEVDPMTFTGDTQIALRRPVLTAKNPTDYPYALVLRTTDSYSGEWYLGSENDWPGAACIVTEIEKEYYPYALNIVGVENSRAAINQDWSTSFQVANIGLNPVTSLTYTVSVDEGTPVELTHEFKTPVTAYAFAATAVTLPMPPIEDEGSHLVDVVFTKANGREFTAPSQSTYFSVEVLPFATKKRPLIEEYTGLGCGWCPRGFLAMETIAEVYGDDQVSICYHSSSYGADDMTVTSDFVFPNLEQSPGLPTSSVDRLELIDPYYGSPVPYQELGIEVDVDKALADAAYADIDLDVEIVGHNTINVTSTTTFVKDVNNANYQVGYVLVCDNLTHSTWRQNNYYAQPAYYNPALAVGTPLEPLTKKGSSIRGLIFNSVAVDVSGMKGVAGSIPTSIKAMEPITHNFTFDISNNRVLNNFNIGEEGYKDLNNLVITAFIIEKTTGKIENANKYAISGWSAVDAVEAEASVVVSAEYFDLSGRKVVNPEKGIFIMSEKLSDGSVRNSKVIL